MLINLSTVNITRKELSTVNITRNELLEAAIAGLKAKRDAINKRLNMLQAMKDERLYVSPENGQPHCPYHGTDYEAGIDADCGVCRRLTGTDITPVVARVKHPHPPRKKHVMSAEGRAARKRWAELRRSSKNKK
jgi:hypothetical protein